MASVVILRSNFASTAWKSEFADRLIDLCPEMNPDVADEVADSVVLHARDMDPAIAAKNWASLHGLVVDEASQSSVASRA